MQRELATVVHSVILRSATLRERIAWYIDGLEFQETTASRARLSKWKKQFQALGEEAFARHIAALGLSMSDLLRVLGSPLPLHDLAFPPWAKLLGSIMEGIADPAGCEETAKRFAPHLRDIPAAFLELYWPVVRCACARMRQSAPEVWAELTDNARTALEAHLLMRLFHAGRQIIQLQFAVFQTVAQAGFGGGESSEMNKGSALPRKFVGAVPGQRLRQLFDEYPVHARHCAVLAHNWIETSRKFLARLAQDRTQLNERFSPGHCLGAVTGLQVGLSDPHHGGETVLAVSFANGCQVVYKPRSLSAEQKFSELLRRISVPGTFRRFRAPRIWDRGDYGWMEFVGALPCHDGAGVKRFYWRAGVLLGLCHLARGVDCHRGNLIAQGEHPVLIDVDALWHPQNLPQPSTVGHEASNHPSIDSVVRTGWLPGGNISGNHLYSAAALECHPGEQHGAFDSAERSRALQRTSHLPHMAQSLVGAARCTKEILAGFRWIGETVVSDAKWRVSFLNWLDRINDLPRRHVLRSTAVYTARLRESCRPAMLTEGVDFSLALKIDLAVPAEAEIEAQESDSLEQLDVPYLCQPPASAPSAHADSLPSRERYFSELAVISEALRNP